MNVFGSPLPTTRESPRMLGPPMELKRDQVLCGRRQDFMSGLSDQHHVFNPDTTLVRNIDAWLNCNHHPRRQLLGLASGQARRFMYLHSHSVAGGMGKELVVTSFLQHFPPSAVHFSCFHAWAHSSY